MSGQDVATMTDEELRQAYNAADKPNVYGAELLRRIHERDREAWGVGEGRSRLR